MAENALPDVPFKAKVLDSQGYLTQVWAAFFRELFSRVGKNIAPSNTELSEFIVDISDIESDIVTLQGTTAALEARLLNVEGGITSGRQL